MRYGRLMIVGWFLYATSQIWSLPEAHAERNWEFSIAGAAGKAFHSNSDMKINSGDVSNPFHGTLNGVNLNDSGAWSAKVSAWYLPRQYNWQPQVGFELNFSRFTADMHPQTVGATGTVSTPGFQLAAVTFLNGRDVSVNNLTANLMFRYPLWATPELPQGRLAPYVGGGLGVQRAHLTSQATGYQQTDYAPAVQGTVGIKLFLTKNVALFTEYDRIWSRHTFTFPSAPAGYSERWTIATNLVTGGLSLHF